mmetsp:Transcript_1472/g.4241  ORF Transcript_1472/g.4241 Transcript_1472/m.4241 type:complete len:214 (+) Transcript_1472:228-869(+)
MSKGFVLHLGLWLALGLSVCQAGERFENSEVCNLDPKNEVSCRENIGWGLHCHERHRCRTKDLSPRDFTKEYVTKTISPPVPFTDSPPRYSSHERQGGAGNGARPAHPNPPRILPPRSPQPVPRTLRKCPAQSCLCGRSLPLSVASTRAGPRRGRRRQRHTAPGPAGTLTRHPSSLRRGWEDTRRPPPPWANRCPCSTPAFSQESCLGSASRR